MPFVFDPVGWLGRLLVDPTASVTLALFGATAALWWSTRKLVTTSERTARQQLRAYLGVSQACLKHLNTDDTPEAWLVVRNSGLTPAYDVRYWCNLHFIRGGTGASPPVLLLSSATTTIGPGEHIDIFAQLEEKLSGIALLLELVERQNGIWFPGALGISTPSADSTRFQA